MEKEPSGHRETAVCIPAACLMKIAFTTLGCKLNFAETSTYRRILTEAGAVATGWNAAADAYLINTCAVTEHAEKKSRNLIQRAHRLAPDAPIYVTGCYAELRRDDILALDGVCRVFGVSEKARIVDTLCADLGLGRPAEALSGDIIPAYSSGERTRAFLKVQDGCDNFCAYCTVPFARGRSRNLPICTLVRQAEEIAATGIREIVLTGVNTGDFGRTTGESFLDLLKALNDVKGIDRYRISSIEPNLLTDDIIDWIASGTKVLPHFHIPLQSGSDTLLQRVGRRYDTALFASRIDKVRSAMERPGGRKVFFGIDVIVGLPGETEALFEETFRFLSERIRPAFLHVFPYSRRPGTRAAAWPGQVQDRIKTERVARLEALSDSLHTAFIDYHKGMTAPVLWESTSRDGRMSGFTDNYIKVERPFDRTLVGTISEETI